jgi:hypothetical protein
MAKPPPDPPRDDDDDRSVVDVTDATASTTLRDPSDRSMVEPRRDDVGSSVLYRARVTRADVAKNVAVGLLLAGFVGWFVFGIVFDRPWLGAGLGVLLALSGARFRKEKDEVTPSEIVVSTERRRAVELRFEGAPSLMLDHRTTQHVDAEATGDSREGYTHWVVVRREGASELRVRTKDRAEAIGLSKRLRVTLEVPPLHPLGEDELEGEDFLGPSAPSAS